MTKRFLIFFAFQTFIGAFSFANHTIYLHAHRGEPHIAPQNTVESIKLAYDLGSRMIETDVWLTKDGTMAIVHGRNELKELWGIDKNPSELTLAEIKGSKLAKPDKFDKKYSCCKIPTLEDLFAVIPKDKWAEIEIKGYGKEFACKLDSARQRAGLDADKLIITSFDASAIKDFKSQYPQYETMYIIGINKRGEISPEEIISRAKDAGASQVAIGGYRNIDRNFVSKIQNAGLKVGVWQVENLEDLAIAIELGADRICSNYANNLRKSYRALKKSNME